LKYNPDNIPVLNNYAYYLSLEQTDLDKAEEMSYRTIKAEPNNATYLDTYAWILFQLGQYNDALFYIRQAIDNIDIKTKNIDLEAETNDLDPETYKEIQHHYKAILKKAKK
jgi:Tfp pilus assembly protein PilF